MGRYKIDIKNKKRVLPNTMLYVTDSSNGEAFRFSKVSLSRGYSLEYNQELCDALFDVDDMFYKSFPEEYKTDEMTRFMIEKYYKRFYEYYPIKYRDREMSIEYVRYSGSHLCYVPRNQIDQFMCDLFAIANPMCIKEIPDEFMKSEYIDIIFKKGYHLGVVPYKYRSLDVCVKFIQAYKSNIQFVPDEVLPLICKKFGIMYNENLNLDNNDYWMIKK